MFKRVGVECVAHSGVVVANPKGEEVVGGMSQVDFMEHFRLDSGISVELVGGGGAAEELPWKTLHALQDQLSS